MHAVQKMAGGMRRRRVDMMRSKTRTGRNGGCAVRLGNSRVGEMVGSSSSSSSRQGGHLLLANARREVCAFVTSPRARGAGTTAAAAAAVSLEPHLVSLESVPDFGAEPTAVIDGRTVLVSGLNGKALEEKERWPTQAEVMAALPKELFKKDTLKSLMYAAISTGLTVGIGLAAYAFIPLKAAWTPAWLLYAALNGTVATGAWVVAHECGHGAFSSNRKLQDAVGYILHSALLVPYFAWQRSHAVHHSRTNHLSEGETHVPKKATIPSGGVGLTLKESLGKLFGFVNLIVVLVFGWPAYLIGGASGGPVRGKTSHFNPNAGAKGKHALFPGKWKKKVWLSDIGVGVTAALLGWWAYAAGSVLPMLAVYMGPYLVVNAWLVGYTWLQHTDVDVPHFDEEWTWAKGTFMTIDRPYGPILDFLHHRIGSTHVAHHVNHTIPHYNALKATNILKEKYPDLYLYDPTPIHKALWRINTKCIAVKPFDDEKWVYTDRRLGTA